MQIPGLKGADMCVGLRVVYPTDSEILATAPNRLVRPRQ
jgi:hypothetical protein